LAINFITQDDLHIMKRIESHYNITINEFTTNNSFE